MRPLPFLISALLGLILAAGLGLAYDAYGQAAPVPPMTSPSCEQQLDQAQRTIIQLRKANAQSDFQAASLQEALMDLQKKHADAEAKAKAAEKK